MAVVKGVKFDVVLRLSANESKLTSVVPKRALTESLKGAFRVIPTGSLIW